MSYSMSLARLKNIMAVATVLTSISSLVPESAQAILLRFSGSPNPGESNFEFTLDTSVEDSNSEPNEGLFWGAIQEAEYSCTGGTLAFCPNEEREISFLPGTLRASRITTETDLNDYPSSDSFIGGVQYEATLNSQSSSDFIEFGILVNQSSSFDLINSLSALGSLLTNNDVSDSYVGIRSPNSQEGQFIGAGSSFEVVPEPNGASSMLGAGFIGAVLLLKRIKRSRKLQGSQNSAAKTQEVA